MWWSLVFYRSMSPWWTNPLRWRMAVICRAHMEAATASGGLTQIHSVLLIINFQSADGRIINYLWRKGALVEVETDDLYKDYIIIFLHFAATRYLSECVPSDQGKRKLNMDFYRSVIGREHETTFRWETMRVNTKRKRGKGNNQTLEMPQVSDSSSGCLCQPNWFPSSLLPNSVKESALTAFEKWTSYLSQSRKL